jgi:ribonuclease I
MSKLCLLLLFIYISLNSIFTRRNRNRNKNKNKNRNNNYDHYILSIQYKPYYCNIKKEFSNEDSCNNNQDINWTIHGLWPSSFKGKHPFNCSDKKFYFEDLDNNLKENLNKYYPTLYKNNHFLGFLIHEWNKHGTCLNYKKYGIDKDKTSFYFNKAIQLRNHINIDKLNINNDHISMNELVDNLIQLSNIKDKNICYFVCDKVEDKQYLKEIRFIFDLDFNLLGIEADSINKLSNCNRNRNIDWINKNNSKTEI